MAIIQLRGEEELRRGIHYEVDTSAEPIGEGGMGKVFKGLQVDEKTGTTRTVAIKFMFDDLPEQVVERARREASIQLKNDNLIEMMAFLETTDQDATGQVRHHYHVVSELLDGVSLSDLLEGRTINQEGKQLEYASKLLHDFRNDSEHFARIVVMNVLSGLMSLHDAGFIHRDIDPSNIMITSSGHIKLIDFGIAKQMNNLTTNDRSLTVAGKFMGKPEYAAPELVLGDLKHQNQTTDIYAVGILLYQCIVGHTPFEGPRHEVLDKQMKAKLPLDVVKNKALRGIIACACEKKQDLRYQSSAQMRVALETMNPGAVRGGLTKNMKMAIGGGAVALLLVVLGIVLTVNSKKQEAAAAAEKAQMEKFETEKSALAEQLGNAVDNADAMVANVDRESDDYEDRYMQAYQVYADVAQTLLQDSVYHIDIPGVDQKMQAMKNELDSIRNFIAAQISEMQSLGQSGEIEEYIDALEKRKTRIEEFLKNK